MSPEETRMNILIRRSVFGAVLLITPVTLFIGLMSGWEPGQYMVAWAGLGIGGFAMIAFILNTTQCPLRPRGQPRRTHARNPK